MKGFSAAAAIVLSTVASYILFGLQISKCLFAFDLMVCACFLPGQEAAHSSYQSDHMCLLWIISGFNFRSSPGLLCTNVSSLLCYVRCLVITLAFLTITTFLLI